VFSDFGKVESRVVAVGAPWFYMRHLAFLEGSAFDDADEASYEQLCVLGAAAKRRLFGYESAVGKPVKINNVWFTTVGVIADQTVSGDEFEGVQLQNTNNEIYIPLSTALKKIEFKPLESELDGIVLEVSNEGETRATAVVVSKLIAQLHGGESDYSLIVPEQLFEQSRRTQRIFTIIMGCIAGISLLVGGIGIMNIMLANVLERTREIGIRRAIGARRADIRLQFLIEAVAISTLGGVLGVFTGFAIARLVVYLAGWSTIITSASVILAFGVSTAVGVVFGAYPAVQPRV
jgi:putative ABC transport system permease protein